MFRVLGCRELTAQDVGDALQLCASDPVRYAFVAARIGEGALGDTASALTLSPRGSLRSFVWSSANVFPVGITEGEVESYARRLRRAPHRPSSIFGPMEQVLPLWKVMSRSFPEPRSLRPDQPVMVATEAARFSREVSAHPGVRVATPADLDRVVPAAAAMFTEEIGYAPYVGSDILYRRGVADLIQSGRTYVLMDGERLIFKADVGSLACGVAQIQGVWIDPDYRGRGLAAPCMARVVDLAGADHNALVTLYVNSYNTPARRAYERAGFEQVATFATVIL